MFSRSKPEWEGLSGREKKTVRDNKKQLSPFAQHDNVSQGNVTWSRTKQQRVSLIELLSSWSARGACELHVTCTLVLEVLSLLSSIIIFCLVYFRAPFSFFWSRLISFLSSLFHERTRKTLGTRIHVTTAEQFELWIHITIQPTTQHLRFKVQYCHADSQSMGAIKVITICRNFQIVNL